MRPPIRLPGTVLDQGPTPSRWGRALVAVLTLYAVAVITPDTLRIFPTAEYIPGFGRWYPLGSLGFEADNNGKITVVDKGGPAAQAGIVVNDVIDLVSTPLTARRAINKFVFVANDRPHTLRIAMRGQPAINVTLEPMPERLSSGEKFTLFLAQFSAFFFIGLCAYLVWTHPTPQTWGLFLYSIWFNSGQYFVWYANLPDAWLIAFDYLQALFEALGLTGILLFALYFPRDAVDGWRRVGARLLVLPAAALLVVGVWKFRNFTHGEPTEMAYRVYYVLTYLVYAAVFGLFWHTFRTQVAQRPRIRWVILGALWGLLWFLLADTYEATGMFGKLELPQWALDFLYAQSVGLPLAVFYAIRYHRVIKVRFAITRGLVFGSVFTILAVALKLTEVVLEHTLMHKFEWLQPLKFPVVGTIAVVATGMHGGLHRLVETVFFRRWHEVQGRLRAVAERLADGDDVGVDAVHRTVLDEPVAALELTCGGLFRRTEGGDFERERCVGWPEGCVSAFSAGDPIVAALGRRPRALTAADWSAHDRPPDFVTPALAVPIVVRGVVERVLLFGPHVTGEDLDGDETKVLHELAKGAAMAYSRLRTEALERELERFRAQQGGGALGSEPVSRG